MIMMIRPPNLARESPVNATHNPCDRCMEYYWNDYSGYQLDGISAFCDQNCGTLHECPAGAVADREARLQEKEEEVD